jgi:ADP-ribosyl-[dinitrogen reductase] hydrolase
MARRTSLTHPLEIAAVSAGPGRGRIGLTLCPGKYDPYAATGFWERDLGTDLEAIQAWGAAAVVTLIEEKELGLLRVERLGESARSLGMIWFHLPIADYSVPAGPFENQWHAAGRELRALLRAGRDVLVHCKGGLGRSGTIAARLLIELGTPPQAAIEAVRQARPGAIETRAQEAYVLAVTAAQD